MNVHDFTSGLRAMRTTPRHGRGTIRAVLRADALANGPSNAPQLEVDNWVRTSIAGYHSTLKRAVCPFVDQALELNALFYAQATGCQSSDDVVSVMLELVARFHALEVKGRAAHLKTLVVIFPDVRPEDAQRVVIAAHPELKDHCTEHGLMVGEFAPRYQLASTRDASVNVGDAPAPVLVLRHMIRSDRRFLEGEAHWMRSWAAQFAPDRISSPSACPAGARC